MAEQGKQLDITREELERIETAMKNEEFRKMFADYAKEISDPENRKKYEEEIAKLEAERGMDVKFINPQDGFVIKAGMKGEGGKKAFINICQSDAVGKASCNTVNKKINAQNVSGEEWSIPYSLNHPKDDTDRAGKKCVVYDIVFHTKTYEMGQENPRFKQLIIDTTLDAIEGKWQVKLDRKNLKYPKLKFKGSKQATIIRNSNNKGIKEPGADIEFGDKKLSYPYKEKELASSRTDARNLSPSVTEAPSVRHVIIPKHSVVHRGHMDLQNFTNARDSRASTRPQELVVHIELPLCESSSGVDLDIFEKQLILDSSDPLYHLDISLPYPVKEDEGSAKFDKSKRSLIVTLPVMPSLPGELTKPTDNVLDTNLNQDSTLAPDDPSSVADEGNGVLLDCDVDDNDNGLDNCVQTKSELNCAETGNENELSDGKTETAVNPGDDVIEEKVGDVIEGGIDDVIEGEVDDVIEGEVDDVIEGEVEDIIEGEVDDVNEREVDDVIEGEVDDVIEGEIDDVIEGDVDDVIEGEVDDVIEGDVDDEVFDEKSEEEVSFVIIGSGVDGVDAEIEENDECSAPRDLTVHFNKDKTTGIACPFFKIPEYAFHQDNQSVTFVLHVANVSIDTTSLGFSANKCYINFPSTQDSPTSLSSPGYALYIQFPDDCLINSEKSKIDSNEKNLVLVLYKQENSAGLWDWFMIGSDEEKLEKRFFLTETNLEQALDQNEDPWVQPSLVSNFKVERVCEDAALIRLEVESKDRESNKMGNIMRSVEELLSDEVKNIDAVNSHENSVEDTLNSKGILSPGDLCVNGSEEPLKIEKSRDGDSEVLAPEADENGVDYGELDEVEVIEVENPHEETAKGGQHGLSTVQEDENVGNEDVSGNAEMQRARAIKCRKNRRRRRRSTGSHESSSVSEEEGEAGTGRSGKTRGKHARRLRKTRSLSLGSSAESHDDAENSSQGNGRCVRFNLVPEVHLFSKKSDKKKWKELTRQQVLSGHEESGSAGDESCSVKSSLKYSGNSQGNVSQLHRTSANRSSDDGESNTALEVEAAPSDVTADQIDNSINGDASDVYGKPQLTNSLIFDLDD